MNYYSLGNYSTGTSYIDLPNNSYNNTNPVFMISIHNYYGAGTVAIITVDKSANTVHITEITDNSIYFKLSAVSSSKIKMEVNYDTGGGDVFLFAL